MTDLVKEENVQQDIASDGTRIYRIGAQVLPHLYGYVHLLLHDDRAACLIDAGSGEDGCPDQIRNGFDVINRCFEKFSPRSIKRIILTHTHTDHFGGVRQWQREFDAEVWCHAFESRVVCSFNERATISNHLFARFLLNCGVPRERVPEIIYFFGFLPGRFSPATVSKVLYGNEQIDGMTIHHFPGHSAGSIAIQVGDRLISGDHLLSNTITQIWPERITPHTGLTHYLQSLEKLRNLAQQWEQEHGVPLVALPGHEEPIQNIPARLALIHKSNERRNHRLLELVDRAEAPPSVYELSRHMYLTTHVNRELFAMSDVGSRVEYLQQHARLAVVNYDEIDLMQPAVFRYATVQSPDPFTKD